MRVSRSASLRIAGTHPAIPKGRRAAIRFWGYASGAVILAGIVYAFFGGWYWAIIGIVVGFGIEAANRQSAQQFVAEAAQRDKDFAMQMVVAGVIRQD
jgi:hypothetical protein